MQELMTKMRLLRFDGQVLEMFMANGSERYHVAFISKVAINEKRKQLEFDYGPMPRPIRLGFDASELGAVGEFMRAVEAAAT